MTLEILEQEFAVCKLERTAPPTAGGAFVFYARTDREVSLVCAAEHVPQGARAVEAGWLALRVAGTLAFGLVGVLAQLSGILAGRGVSLFAVSTFDTDYILVKREDRHRALAALAEAGHIVVPAGACRHRPA